MAHQLSGARFVRRGARGGAVGIERRLELISRGEHVPARDLRLPWVRAAAWQQQTDESC
jgi:hypothetical protein